MEQNKRRKRRIRSRKTRKKRKHIKSIVAAYISGQLPLWKIMHPSRLTLKNKNHPRAFDINEIEKMSIQKRIPNLPKQQILKDYIDRNETVSTIPIKKISEVSSKSKESNKTASVKNNFSLPSNSCKSYKSSQRSELVDGNWLNRENKSVKSVESILMNRSSSMNAQSLMWSKTPDIKKFSFGDTSLSMRINDTNDIKNSLCSSVGKSVRSTNSSKADDSYRYDFQSLEPTEEVMYNINNKNHKLKTPSICEELKQRAQARFESFSNSLKNSSSRSTSTNLSKRYIGSIKLHEREKFLNLIKSHENVEECLIKQIIHLRKERDRYKRSYVDLIKIHKILANKWFQFSKLNID
ncbi:hypothetical protein PGB90_002591 [Kerria lacca]